MRSTAAGTLKPQEELTQSLQQLFHIPQSRQVAGDHKRVKRNFLLSSSTLEIHPKEEPMGIAGNFTELIPACKRDRSSIRSASA